MITVMAILFSGRLTMTSVNCMGGYMLFAGPGSNYRPIEFSWYHMPCSVAKNEALVIAFLYCVVFVSYIFLLLLVGSIGR